MRIDRLELDKYGRFTGCAADFSGPGVHLVIGPNEAGKSTMRDAVTDLLYGIPRQTAYGYLHDMRDLRISALVRSHDGRALEIVRLKRDRDSLRTTSDAVLEQRELDAMLAGVTKDDFTKVFAVDHEELRRGGAALLAGKGDLAKALFESRSSAQLTTLLSRIQTECVKLFVPRGKNPELNVALGGEGPFHTARRNLGDCLLRPEMYREASRLVDEARKNQETVVEELDRARVEFFRLSRIRQAYAGMEQRARLLDERSALIDEGPRADREVSERYEELRTARQGAQIELRTVQDSIEEAENRLRTLNPDQATLSQADEIKYLGDESSAIAKAEKQAAKAGQLAAELREKASARLAEIRPDLAGAARVDPVAPALRVRVDELLRLQLTLDTELRAARKHASGRDRALAKELAKLESIVQPSADLAALRAVIKAVPATLASEITAQQKQCAAAESRLRKSRTRHARFAFPEHAASLGVPSSDEISAHRKRMDAAEKAVTGADERRERNKTELDQYRRALEQFLRHDPPPSEADLQDARARRQRLWSQLRPRLTDGSLAPDEPPVDAYEQAVETGDETVDRMRREAQRLAERKGLEESVERAEQELAKARRQCDVANETLRSLGEQWLELWAPSGLPAPPLEAAADLLSALRTLRDQTDEYDRIKLDLDADQTQATAHTTRLRAALADAGAEAPNESASLSELLESAVDHHAALSDAAKKRANAELNSENLRDEAGDAKREVEALEATLADWRRDWSDLLAEHRFTGTPAQVATVLDELDEIARLHESAAQEDVQAAQARAQVEAFTERLNAALTATGRERLVDPARRHSETKSLKESLDWQVETENERESLIRQAEVLQRRLADAQASQSRHDAALTELLEKSAVDGERDLVDAIERGIRLRDLDKQVSAVESALSSSGASLVQLEHEVAEHDPDQLSAAVTALETTIGRLDERRGEQAAQIALLEQDLRRMDGSPVAAYAADAMEHELARIVHRSQDYLRLRLAEQILLANIEAYRRENQTPVLRRAEHVFGRITHGRLPELLDDVAPDGRPLLRARRDTGQLVDVEDMSEGTRDQLYFALRLASLERYADEGRAMPLLLDDVLMTFDDGRTGAGLELLDEMADRFQVIVFTHHDHIGRLAEASLPPGRIHVHDITPAAV